MSDTDIDNDPGFEVKAAFDFAVEIGGKLDESIAAQKRLLRQLSEATPIMYRPTASAVCPTPSASFVLDLGTPSQGTFWEVRKVVVGGMDFTTAAAGTAGLYLSASPSIFGSGLNNAEDYASSLPSVGYYGTGALYVRPSEYLFLVVFNATAGQTYVANAFCRVYNDSVVEDWIS